MDTTSARQECWPVEWGNQLRTPLPKMGLSRGCAVGLNVHLEVYWWWLAASGG